MNTKKISKAYKFRIYPNNNQIKFFEESVRTSNFIYNTYLRKQIDILDEMKEKFDENKVVRNEYMKENDLWFNKYNASRELTQMAKTKEFKFLKIPDSTTRSYVVKNLDKAFSGIKKGGGFPKFKNKFSKFSYTGQIVYDKEIISNFSLNLKKEKYCIINIPKCKNIKMICHIPFFMENWNIKNEIKFNSYTISKNSKDKYFISFQVEINILNIKQKEIIEEKSVGIDFGVERPITTSNLIDFDNDIYSKRFDILKKYKNELKKYNSIINRKRDYHKKNKTGIEFYNTSSYKRISKKLSDLHFKIANIREYSQHNITKSLIMNDKYDTFIIEDLNIKNMTKKSAKGKSNNKSNLNRVLNDVGLHSIKTKMQYKAEQIGKNVVFVNPKYTSQKCNRCGCINKLNRNKKTQSNFKCISCGYEDNADYNAAINIKNKYFNEIFEKI